MLGGPSTTREMYAEYNFFIIHLGDAKTMWVPLINPSQLDIAGKRSHPSTSSKNISNFLLKISMHAIQFTGGWFDGPSSQTCFALLVTFYVYLVSYFSIFTKHLCVIFTSRFCCCCRAGLLRWSGHHFSPPCKP